jgi:hypothetical protein
LGADDLRDELDQDCDTVFDEGVTTPHYADLDGSCGGTTSHQS